MGNLAIKCLEISVWACFWKEAITRSVICISGVRFALLTDQYSLMCLTDHTDFSVVTKNGVQNPGLEVV